MTRIFIFYLLDSFNCIPNARFDPISPILSKLKVQIQATGIIYPHNCIYGLPMLLYPLHFNMYIITYTICIW